MAKRPVVCVVGNANLDIVRRVGVLPLPGFFAFPADAEEPSFVCGGKGANQAVAAALMGATVRFIGCVGTDDYGDRLLACLRERGVCVDGVVRSTTVPTGTIRVCIDPSGNPEYDWDPGANFALTSADILDRRVLFADADVIVLQNGVPPEALLAVRGLARECGIRVVFNPAPSCYPIGPEVWEGVDWIIPNVEEAFWLSGADSLDQATIRLRASARNTVITRGADGVLAFGPDVVELGVLSVSAHTVIQVDAVGASDCWIGAFAAQIGSGANIPDALRFANIAAALACTNQGAMESFPTLGEVLVRLVL